jgi:putative transposase
MNHIRTNAATKGIYIDQMNGGSDHLHCILLLNCDQTLSKVMQVIREESTYWINRNRILKEKFEWDNDYYGLSFSTSHFVKVADYINRQDEYHKLKSWDDECSELMKYYGFYRCNI